MFGNNVAFGSEVWGASMGVCYGMNVKCSSQVHVCEHVVPS